MKEYTGYKKGINLGGWLSQCKHESRHHEEFISESDIKCISEWGLDHVRLPIDYELIRDDEGTFIEEGFVYIDRCLAWCEKYQLNMILDLHKTAGFSFDEKVNSFFDSAELQDKFISLWDELSKRYGRYHSHLSLELLNEVVEEEVADLWNEIIRRTIAVIRKNAPTIKILVGGVRNNSVFWVRKLDQPYDENIVYTFHFYEPLIFTHQSAYWVDKMPSDFSTEYPNDLHTYIEESKKFLPPEHSEIYQSLPVKGIDQSFFKEAFSDAIQVARERNVPLYCGEYGVIDQTSLPSAINWYTDIHDVFEEYGISRAAWTYKGKDFGIVDEHYRDILTQLIKLL